MTSLNRIPDTLDWGLLLPVEDAVIVQLGANDGIACEEYGLNRCLKEQNHMAILVEPMSGAFANLALNYAHAASRLHFENLAIAHDRGTGKARLYLSGVESSLVRHRPGHEDDHEVVRLETFQYLIDKYRLTHLDAVFMDIEGLEYNVIKDILENCTIQPNFLRYEFLLSDNIEGLDQLLMDHGYMVFMDATHKGDKIAVMKDVYERLSIL